MSIELKIKSKSLAVEAQIIRHEEKKVNRPEVRCSLHHHRTIDVRDEARATFLARAFIQGRAYSTVESKVIDRSKLYSKVLPRVLAMVAKYSSKVPYETIKLWTLADVA